MHVPLTLALYKFYTCMYAHMCALETPVASVLKGYWPTRDFSFDVRRIGWAKCSQYALPLGWGGH